MQIKCQHLAKTTETNMATSNLFDMHVQSNGRQVLSGQPQWRPIGCACMQNQLNATLFDFLDVLFMFSQFDAIDQLNSH